ncbi:MAG: hypothetical protein WCX65_16220 [bacterium]
MKKSIYGYAVALLCAVSFLTVGRAAAQVVNSDTEKNNKWYKADLHTHYTYREPLENDIAKYRETGYQFLVLSAKDMDKPTKFSKFTTPEMLVTEGVEQSFLTRKNMLGHIIAFPIKSPYPFTSSWTLKEGYAKMRAKNKNVILGINHPHDQRWTLDDVLEADAEGIHIIELNSIDMKHGEFETPMWDAALSKGAHMYAMLTNDVHQFADIDAYGYILIQAKALTLDDMLEAIAFGSFYAVESGCDARLGGYEITGEGGARKLVVNAPGAKEIRIISDGHVAVTTQSENAEYQIKGDEVYARAVILDKKGLYLFAQPFFIKK